MDWQSADRSTGSNGTSPELLELLIQQIQWGVLLLDGHSRCVIQANDPVRRLLGLAGLEEGSPTALELVGFRPDGRRYRSGEWPHDRALAGLPVTEPEEIEIESADGSRARMRVTAVPVPAGGDEVGTVLVTFVESSGSGTSVDPRKFLAKANALFASSLDFRTTLRNLARLAVPALGDWCTIDLLDASGAIERVAVEHMDPRKSRAATELSRRHPPPIDANAGIARSIRNGQAQLVEPVTDRHLEELSRTPKHRKLLEELGILSLMVVPLVTRGRTIGAIGFVSAESGRRYGPEDLELAQELATRAALAIENARLLDESRIASQAKSDFLAVISHELRTPLTAIIGYSELLQMGVPEPVSPRQAEQAERIEASARHLLQLIEEILALVSLDSGEGRIREREVHVNEMLGRVAGLMEPMARAKGLALHVGFAAGEAKLESDPDKLLQILLSLLSNAVKFTETGEIRISARTSESAVTFEVRDTGIGLNPEDTRKIFEPFWQVERPITRKAGGTGLGLTIARRLLDLLGGAIEVESAVASGSTFRVHIPMQPSASHDERVPLR